MSLRPEGWTMQLRVVEIRWRPHVRSEMGYLGTEFNAGPVISPDRVTFLSR
jgi:hypothetical protein